MPGIVDDVYGANFVQGTKSGDPYDDNGHGTFVAGVVGAVGNNGVGASGISQVASIIGAQMLWVLSNQLFVHSCTNARALGEAALSPGSLSGDWR